MADKKENELTSANNFEWVRALDANGNSIRISKAGLVSVLEELLPVVSSNKNGLMDKDIFRGIMYTSNIGYGTTDTKTYVLIKGAQKFSAIISESKNGNEIELFYIGVANNNSNGKYAQRIAGSSSFSHIYIHKTEDWFLISGLGIWAPVGILCLTGELIELTPVDSSEFSLSDYNQLL